MKAPFKGLNPVMLILLTTFLVCLALAWSFHKTSVRHLDSIRLIELHQAVQNDVTTAHLWLEQLLAGDLRINPELQIYRPYQRASTNLQIMAADALLTEPDEPQSASGIAVNLAQSSAEGCQELFTMAQGRIKLGTAGGAGSAADIAFEVEYHQVMNRLELLKAIISQQIAKLHASTRTDFYAMIGATVVVLITLAAVVARSRDCARSRAAELERVVKERTSELQSLSSQLQGVADSVVDAIVTSDREGRITSLNLAAIKMFGYAPAAAVGQPITLLMPPHFRAAHEAGMKRVVAAGSSAQLGRRVQVSGMHLDGREFPVEITLTAWQAGARGGFTALIRDVSIEKAAAEKMAFHQLKVEKLNGELEAANASLIEAASHKDQFLAAMSHELRTPLTVILSYSQLLLDRIQGPLNERQVRYVDVMAQSGQHLLNLISEVLDVVKLDAGKLRLHLDTVHLGQTCRSCLQMMEPLAREKRLRLIFEIPDDLPSLRGDPQRIAQILLNLLSNAVKFTPNGGTITVTVAVVPTSANLCITVADTGIGISEDYRSRLFQPFMQVDSTLSRQHGGTGLGLALVAKLAGLHGGGVSLDSEVGRGSRFHVTLPILGPSQPSDLPPDTAPH